MNVVVVRSNPDRPLILVKSSFWDKVGGLFGFAIGFGFIFLSIWGTIYDRGGWNLLWLLLLMLLGGGFIWGGILSVAIQRRITFEKADRVIRIGGRDRLWFFSNKKVPLTSLGSMQILRTEHVIPGVAPMAGSTITAWHVWISGTDVWSGSERDARRLAALIREVADSGD